MKKFTRVEPTDTLTVGDRYKRKIIVKRFHTEDGGEHEFTTLNREGSRAGAVVALTPDRQVIITYQFRAGPERWMNDLPGGGLNEGEDVQAGVLRELKEETGYVSAHVELLGTSSRDAYTNTTWHYFMATDCELSETGRELDAEEESQGAEVQLISIAELIDNAKHDRMTDPAAVLMAYDKLKELEKND